MRLFRNAQIGSLSRLTDPFGGTIVDGRRYSFPADEPQLFVQVLTFRVFGPEERNPSEASRSTRLRSASGSESSPDGSSLLALAEVVERHAAYCHAAYCKDKDRILTATASELGPHGLDLGTLPRCSVKELQNPKCSVELPRRDKPMRWIEGISLMTGRPCALPVGLVCLSIDTLERHERLQTPISTGLAARCCLTRHFWRVSLK